MKRTLLRIGTVSHGTMREEDLIPTFLSTCDDLRLTEKERYLVNAIKRRAYADDTEEYYNGEDAQDDCTDLFDILNNHCPAYCHFGSTESDGSDYGCWPSVDSVVDDLRYGEIHDTDKAPKGYRGFIVSISDHGNVTLYNRVAFGHGYKDIEIWGIV